MMTLLELIPIVLAVGAGAFSRSVREILKATFHKPTKTTVVCTKADGTTMSLDFDGMHRDLSSDQIHTWITRVHGERDPGHSTTLGDDGGAHR